MPIYFKFFKYFWIRVDLFLLFSNICKLKIDIAIWYHVTSRDISRNMHNQIIAQPSLAIAIDNYILASHNIFCFIYFFVFVFFVYKKVPRSVRNCIPLLYDSRCILHNMPIYVEWWCVCFIYIVATLVVYLH